MFAPGDRIPALGALRDAVLRHDGDAVAAAFEAHSDEDDRALACRVVAGIPDHDGFLRQAVDRDPRGPLARSLLADRLIQAGWTIGSGYRAQHVTRQQFGEFHAHLRRAEVLLIDVCAEHPQYALAWYLRVITSRGLELGLGETRRGYERLVEHHPHHYPGRQQLLRQICPKWGGTRESAHGFAAECARAAPPGSPNGALVAIAQMEQYLELRERAGDRAAETYLRGVDTRQALLVAAAHSVLHPAARAEAHQLVGAHSAFAAAHCAAGRHAGAAAHFRALGDRASEFPWGCIGGSDHEAEFARHRKTALAKG